MTILQLNVKYRNVAIQTLQLNNEMQQNQICAICERQPEDLLVLVCGHNLCVSCATQIYTLNQSANPFVCEICLVQTELDQQTIQCFRSTNERIFRQDKVEESITPKMIIKNEKKVINSKPPKSKSPQRKDQERSICKIHNQPALYYCYNCNTVDICSECILTPKHSNHRVVTIKKAYTALEKKIQEELNMFQNFKQQLEGQKQYLLDKKQQVSKFYKKKKLEMKSIFDEIARAVSDKYAQMNTKIQEEHKKSLQVYEAYVGQIEQKQKLIGDSLNVYQRVYGSHDQSTILQWMNKGITETGKELFCVSFPKQMPGCSLQFFNVEAVYDQINNALGRIGWIKPEEEQEMNYSVIKQQNLQQQPIRTILKQSYKGSINKSHSRVGGSSRKLDLSRSIQNATYIINRLHQRSKNT